MRRVKPKSERPAGQRKQSDLVATLRRRIVDGTYRAGERLPPHVELLDDLGASPVTLQRAMDRLSADGFIEPRGRHGTFVVERPPHLCNYALVFDSHPADPLYGWSRFWTALTNAADTIARATGLRINIYHDINGHSDSEPMQLLIRQLESHCLAGLIFTSPPFLAAYSPIVEMPGVARVAIMTPQSIFNGIPSVMMDRVGWAEQAMNCLAARGRRRVAFLVTPFSDDAHFAHFEAALARRGMTTRPYWMLAVAPDQPRWAERSAHVLLRQQGAWNERPDALVIVDDHLVEHALRGVVAAGVRVPEDLEIVAHGNFPEPSQPALPIQRIGFDARQILWNCIEAINRQRRGETVSDSSIIPAMLEGEQLPAELDFLSAERPITSTIHQGRALR